MTTIVYFREGVVPMPGGLRLIRFIFNDSPRVMVGRDTGGLVKIEDVAEEGRQYARITSLPPGQPDEIVTFSDETRTGLELGMDRMVEKIEHESFPRREQGG